MMHKSHLVTAGATLLALNSTAQIIYSTLPTTFSKFIRHFALWCNPDMGVNVTSFVLFFLGALLPDIDAKNSFIAKKLHINLKNVEHRTIVHTLWWPLLLILLTILFDVPSFFALALGFTIHLIFDNMSPTGIVWFYLPCRDKRVFKRYDSGVKIKRGHFWHLYKTGKPSEILVCVVTVVISVVLFIVDLFVIH